MSIRSLLDFAFVCALLVPGSALAQVEGKGSPAAKSEGANSNGAEQELIKLRHNFSAAELRGDTAALDQLFADDYTHVHSDGKVETKASFMKRYTPSRRFQLNEIEDINVRIYGMTAVLLTRAHIKSTNNGVASDVHTQFVEVWVQRQGKWRIVAWVTTRVPQSPGASAAGR